MQELWGGGVERVVVEYFVCCIRTTLYQGTFLPWCSRFCLDFAVQLIVPLKKIEYGFG